MIRFNASEIAAIVGCNPYKKAEEAITDCWNRHARKRGIDAPKAPTFILEAYKVVDRNKDKVGTLMQDIKESSGKTETSTDTLSTTETINAKINAMDITKEEKETLVTYAKSRMFTNYGTRKEESVHEIYKTMTGNDIGIVNKMFKKPIEDFEIGGKIDGQLEDGTVIEIKNRTRRLFGEVKQYENIQIQTYIQMLEQEGAQLVECYNDGEKKHVNILDVAKDQDLWDETILPGLKKAKTILEDMFETKK
jgi:hypothetical protein